MKNLGFGMMRLPVISGPTDFDYNQLNEMTDAFLEAGFTYSDTSFVYHNGKSEVIQFTEKKTTEFPYNVELGHKQPANLTEKQSSRRMRPAITRSQAPVCGIHCRRIQMLNWIRA